MIFSFFAVPREYQFRVLFWGIFGALVLRDTPPRVPTTSISALARGRCRAPIQMATAASSRIWLQPTLVKRERAISARAMSSLKMSPLGV